MGRAGDELLGRVMQVYQDRDQRPLPRLRDVPHDDLTGRRAGGHRAAVGRDADHTVEQVAAEAGFNAVRRKKD